MDRGALIAGDGAVTDTAADGVPRIAPATADGIARLLRHASTRAMRVRIEHDGWSPSDAPVDLAVSTRQLAGVSDVSAVDQVATVAAGTPVEDLRAGVPWIAMDPPGIDRTVGGALATGSAGPLRAGFGGLRDQVLGLTAVTGDGRVLTMGGRVMKNVAGYDLARLMVGGFDAFGVIVGAHLRLRTAPREDHTSLLRGDRGDLARQALALLERGAQPAAIELTGTTGTWTLALRAVRAIEGDPAPPDYWNRVAAGPDGAVVLRVGTVPDGVTRALTLLDAEMPVADWVSASFYPGAVRWSGSASPDNLRAARLACARHEMPLTLERAPWAARTAVGVHGAYREGVAPLVAALKAAFDPAGVLGG